MSIDVTNLIYGLREETNDLAHASPLVRYTAAVKASRIAAKIYDALRTLEAETVREAKEEWESLHKEAK